MYTHCYRSV